MQYFVVVQDGLKDQNPDFNGPYSSVTQAEKATETNYQPEEDFILTILAQDGVGFKQISQAVIEPLKFPWVRKQ